MATFNENDHPRDGGGKFSEGEGSSKSGEAEGKKKRGEFGTIHTEYRHDVRGAVDRLKQDRDGECLAALHHKDVGDISLVWGWEGTKDRDYENGRGLAKIIKKHSKEIDPYKLQEILDRMHVFDQEGDRVRLTDGRRLAVVKLTKIGGRQQWLLTAFNPGRDYIKKQQRIAKHRLAKDGRDARQGQPFGPTICSPDHANDGDAFTLTNTERAPEFSTTLCNQSTRSRLTAPACAHSTPMAVCMSRFPTSAASK